MKPKPDHPAPTRTVGLLAMAAILVGAGLGCAPTHFIEGVAWTIRREGATNAAYQRVRHRPDLRMDSFLIDRLDHLQTEWDTASARREMQDLLARSRHLALHASGNEIDRLSNRALRALWRRYFPDEEEPINLRLALGTRFRSATSRRFLARTIQVASMESIDDLHRTARSIRKAVAPSPKDHHGGGWLLSLIASTFEVPRGPLDHGGPMIDVYEPGDPLTCPDSNIDPERSFEDQLLLTYAPVIVQERDLSALYDQDVDRIGTVGLSGQPVRNHVVVDTRKPSVYAYWQYTWVHGRKHLQLTYTHWFPEHPRLKPFDEQSGRIEGATLRITLDCDHRPVLFETLLNCGCYHRCYPSERLERAACAAYGEPLPGKRFCIERIMPDKLDWIVPETVKISSDPRSRPVLFSRAGYHGLAGVSFNRDEFQRKTIHERRQYTLRCYETLEHLPIGDGFASMFETNGLVRGAERLEGAMLASTGMLSAGQPRQRGTQLLHWDDYDFDDPHLLEKCLRIPEDFASMVRRSRPEPVRGRTIHDH